MKYKIPTDFNYFSRMEGGIKCIERFQVRTWSSSLYVDDERTFLDHNSVFRDYLSDLIFIL